MNRTKENCIHYGGYEVRAFDKCRVLRDDVWCDPENCSFHCTAEQIVKSFEKARENYKRRHGKDGYFAQPNVVPKAYMCYLRGLL